MNTTILLPHYGTGMMTAYSVAQILKYKGEHEVELIIIDNNAGDGSIEYLKPFEGQFTYIPFPKDRMQSHSLAFEYCLENGYVKTPYFITIESDSFPTQDGFLNYYENLIKEGYDCAGSLLKLSGGTFIHPCACLYSKSAWQEAKDYVKTIPYKYYPNFMMRDNFPLHTMIHDSLIERVSKNPEDWVELSSIYKGDTAEIMKEKLEYYSPIGQGVFHNGIGFKQESVNTYGFRTPESEKLYTSFNEKSQKIIGRAGMEPGQFWHYLMVATGKKIFHIPTETKWIDGKLGEQQEYTLMENGFKHIWCGTAYTSMKDTSANDIYEFKKKQIEDIFK